MKNTKHTEMNDSSIEQENQENLSQSKRKILTSIGVTSGVVGASALVPSTWVKPAVNSVILPAHAESTPAAMMTTEMPTGTGDPAATTTTDAPATDGPMVMVASLGSDTVNVDGDTAATKSYEVVLSHQPDTNVVIGVAISGAGTTNPPTVTTGATLTFTRRGATDSWDTHQNVVVTIPENYGFAADALTDDVTVTFKVTDASSDDAYDGQEMTRTITLSNTVEVAPTMVMATRSTDFLTPGNVTVTWVAPATNAVLVGYVVTGGTMPAREGPGAEGSDLTGVAADAMVVVTAHYMGGGIEAAPGVTVA